MIVHVVVGRARGVLRPVDGLALELLQAQLRVQQLGLDLRAQVAGLVARRILCDAKAGDSVQAGERFGIIRFGSRTDVYLPVGVLRLAREGQTMLGGETGVAELVPGAARRAGAGASADASDRARARASRVSPSTG